MLKLSAIGRIALVALLIIVIIVAAGAGYLASSSRTVTSTVITTAPPVTTTIPPVTTTVYTNYVNTFFSSSCSISEVGGFEFRTISDLTGVPLNVTSMSAVDRLGCNNENQVVYLDNFSYMGEGWFTPVFPSQATLGGGLNITVAYEGKTYSFIGDYPPVGTDCVTLSVPSGNVSSTTVMNGSGSYCSASTIASATTATKLIIITNVAHVSAYTCGTESFVGGTAYANITTSTEYIFSSTTNTTAPPELANVTTTTVTSSPIGIASTVTDTTITLTASTSGNSTICPTVV